MRAATSADYTTGCTADPAPLPADMEEAVLRVRDTFAGRFETSMRWGDGSLPENLRWGGAYWTEQPSGYEVTTRLTANVTLGEAQFFKGRPSSAFEPDLSCPDGFQVPATVEFATADGALAGTAEGYAGNGYPMRLVAEMDMADTVGTMDLGLDPDLEYYGDLSFGVTAYPEGKKGWLYFSVAETARRTGQDYWRLTGDFPDDGCGSSGFPASADAPQAWLGGQSVAEHFASWRTELSSLVVEAVRGDCVPDGYIETPVELRFELGSPDTDVCQFSPSRLNDQYWTASFKAVSRVTSSDGLIDMTLSEGRMSVSGESGVALPAVGLGALSDWLPGEQFAAQVGIRGVDPRNSVSLQAYTQTGFGRIGGTIVSSGSVRVEGMENCTSPDSCSLRKYAQILWPLNDTSLVEAGVTNTKDWLCR